MPGNAIVTPLEMEAEKLKKSELIITEIAEQINAQYRNQFDGENDLSAHLQSLIIIRKYR